MGAFGDMGGVLMGKQGEGSKKSLETDKIKMTVMKVNEESGLNK